ncbi:MAG: TetR/AcrR family transcriptional regulator [Bacilli bacterium]|nr:TetR/AcrR family transcriptional regulator [Bacilli bacterium]
MRTEKMRLDNIEKVYRATIRLFEKNNVMNTTLQMIANEAGVSTRSIVNYFKTRENLLLAVHQRYVDSALTELDKHCATEKYKSLNGREQVLDITRHVLDFVPNFYVHIYAMREISIAVSAAGITDDKRFINEAIDFVFKPAKIAMQKGLEDGSITLAHGYNEDNLKMFIVVLRGVFEEYAEILKSKNEAAIKTVSNAIETLYNYLDAILRGQIKK